MDEGDAPVVQADPRLTVDQFDPCRSQRVERSGQVVNQVGDMVKAGQMLLVIEAMKMEHGIVAPIDGKLAGTYVKVGDQVAPGQVLADISADT